MSSTGLLIINETEIELSGSVSFPLNFSIADIKEPEKRKRNYSRTVVIPGTRSNLEFFSSTYDLSLTSLDNTTLAGFDFDPTVRAEAKYYKKGTLVFDGLIQVNSVEIKDGDYFFKCTLYSNFVDLYMILKDILVSELGWSEYDHTLDRTIIRDSWDASVLVNGVATPNFTGGNPDGFGYVYPLINYGYPLLTPTTYRSSDLVPFVYWREIIQKCLELAGYTFESNFLDTELFKKLIFGFGGGEKLSLTAAEVAQRQSKFHGDFNSLEQKSYSSSQYFSGIGFLNPYYNLTFQSFSTLNLLQNSNFTETIDQDTLSQYDTITGEVTCALSGKYKIELSGVLNFALSIGSMTSVSQGGYKAIRILKNGVAIPNGFVTIGTFGLVTINKSVELDLISGDVLKCECFFSGNVVTSVDTLNDAEPISLTISDTVDVSFNMTSIESSVSDGSNVLISRYIPKIKASDFLSSVIKAFNLMLSDPDIDGVIKIEPLEDYYKPTTEFDDITDLVDESKPIKINPPSSTIKGRFYKFLWSEDKDYDNTKYIEAFGIGYGDKVYEVESTFQDGDRIYKLPFAQSVPVDIVNTTLVIPRIIKYDESTSITKPFKGKPRVFFYNGLKTGNWRLTNSNNQSSYDDLIEYPCAHHLDNKDNPTFDLNFGVPLLLYYTASAYVTDNLFSRFHERFIKEITGRDAKLIEIFVKTNAERINKLDFSLLKMWNGVLFRLNEVSDYDDDVTSSTKYELVKILQSNSPRRISLPTAPIKNLDDTTVLTGGNSNTNTDVSILGGGKKSASVSSSINSNS